MSIAVEKRIQKLEDELKALKSTYMLSGGAVKTYLSYSQTIEITDWYNDNPLIMKFKSDFGDSKEILVASFFLEQTTLWGDNYNFSQYVMPYEQTGDGTITFKVPLSLGVGSVKIGMVSTVPGTFTRIL